MSRTFRSVTLVLTLSLAAACGQQAEIMGPAFLATPGGTVADGIWQPNDETMPFADLIQVGQDRFRTYETMCEDEPLLCGVTKEMGRTVINMNQLPITKSTAGSTTKGWSSWWFPYQDNEGAMWRETDKNRRNPTLKKYDEVRKLIAQRDRLDSNFPRSTEAQKAIAERFGSSDWEGLCDAWAMASISHPEPTRPANLRIRDKSFTFSVNELKALLINSFSGVETGHVFRPGPYFDFYGIKFTGKTQEGDPRTNPDARPESWIYPDMFPDQFFRLVEKRLMEEGRPLIIDHTAGVVVWNHAVREADYYMEAVPGVPNAVAVMMNVYLADKLSPDKWDSLENPTMTKRYFMILKGDRAANGMLTVTKGAWAFKRGSVGITNNSEVDHPDFAWVPKLGSRILSERKSENPEIDTAVVDEILKGTF